MPDPRQPCSSLLFVAVVIAAAWLSPSQAALAQSADDEDSDAAAGSPQARDAEDADDDATGTAPTPADIQRAEDLIREGVALRREGEDDAALEKFESAYALHPTPRGKAQIGLAEAALGRWVIAEAHLEEALAAESDPWITQARPTLERTLQTVRQRLGSIEVLGGVPGAEVRLDGRPVGTLPLDAPIRVVAGTVTLVVDHPDHYPVERRVVVPRARLTRETVQLNPRPREAPAAAGTGAAAGTAAAAAAATGAGAPGTDDAPPPSPPTGSPPQATAGAGTPNRSGTGEPFGPATGTASAAPPAPTGGVEDTAPARAALPAPERVEQAPKNTGFVLQLLGAAGGFLHDPIERTTGISGFDLSPGFGASLRLGGRVSPYFSFGVYANFALVGTEDDLQVDRAWALAPGAYLRLHSGRLVDGLLDLWAGSGVSPYSRVQVDISDGSSLSLVALTVPVDLGLTLFFSDAAGIDLGTSFTGWFPSEVCVEGDCVSGSLDSFWSWQVVLGLSFLLG